MEFANTQDLQGQPYQLWRKASFAPQAIDVNLKGLLEGGSVDPRAIQGEDGQLGAADLAVIVPPLEPWTTWAMVGLVLAALLGAVGMALQRGSIRTSYSQEDLVELRASLLQRIAHIDDLHALGELNETDWLRERAQLKTQLVDVIGRLNRGKQA
jgi:hypothetical protein